VHNPVYAQVLLVESVQQFDLLPPKAGFSVSTVAGCAPLIVNFTDESHGDVATWNWGFGDDLGISSATNPSYTYDTAGIYTVSLAVTGSYGADAEIKLSLIEVFAPQAVFTASETSACDSVTVTFTDNSPGDIIAWLWDFGDGIGTSVLQNPDYLFSVVGNYDISLTVTDSCGQTTLTVPGMIVIAGAVPAPDFSADFTTTDTSTTITFTDLTPEQVAVWDWDFGDGITSPLQNPTHKYAQVGTYTVTLTATNGCGNSQVAKTDYITIQ
jgi:PKD repeat protein